MVSINPSGKIFYSLFFGSVLMFSQSLIANDDLPAKWRPMNRPTTTQDFAYDAYMNYNKATGGSYADWLQTPEAYNLFHSHSKSLTNPGDQLDNYIRKRVPPTKPKTDPTSHIPKCNTDHKTGKILCNNGMEAIRLPAGGYRMIKNQN